jgi:hypothetical protein
MEVSGLVGAGTDDTVLATAADGDELRISAGGGLGLAGTFGFAFSPDWDLDLTAGFQRSEDERDFSDADATFRRNFFLATLKYKIPISSLAQFKFGIGGGLYESGKLETDLNTLPPATPTSLSVDYREAFGWHATGELETFLAPRLSLLIGAKYYNVEYEAESARENGVRVATAALRDDVRNLNGNGFDFMVGLSAYF